MHLDCSDPRAPYARVWLNGKEQKLCTTADTTEGYIVRYIMDDNDKFTFVDGVAQTERLEGEVKITFDNSVRN